MEEYGLDVEVEYPFTERLMNTEPEEFIKHIEDFKKAAPYYTEEDIVAILDEEQDKKIRPPFWNRPWM